MFDYENYLPNDILVKMDRASMANSIEVRSPFLDHRIHEFAAKLPRKWLIVKNNGKKLLRDVARKYLPREVTESKKKGFGIPLDKWTRNQKYLEVLKLKFSKSMLFSRYLNGKGVENLLNQHVNLKINGGAIIWRLSMLMDWEDRYMNRSITDGKA